MPTVWLRLLGKRYRMPQHQLPGAAVATEDQRGRSGDVLRGAVHRVVLVDPTGQYPRVSRNALVRISKLRFHSTHRGHQLTEEIVYLASAAQPASRALVDTLDVLRQHLAHPISVQGIRRREEVGCDITQFAWHQTDPPLWSAIAKSQLASRRDVDEAAVRAFHRLGVNPKVRLKWRAMWLWSAKPVSAATWASDCPLSIAACARA